jgi:phosphatidylinositol glycan class P protein
MPPQSRGVQRPNGFQQSKSSPNLATVRALAQQERTRLSSDQRERDTAIAATSQASPYNKKALNGQLHSPEDDEDVTTEEDDDNGEQDDDDDEEEDFPPLDDDEREGLYTTRSHPHLPPSSSQLFPPFYNRPPTPLPPSPSLTSLLRPSFSTHTSHHTTPESSDTESATGASTTFPSGSTHAAASKSASAPRAHPKVPTYEYYGFALYLASSAFFLMYLLWAYLPSPFLHQLGIYYYPNRWWALAIPCWLVVLVAWIYVALASYNTGYLTLAMTNIENVVDEAGKVAVLDREGRILRKGRGESRWGKGKGVKKQRSRQSSVLEQGGGYVPANLGRNVEWRALWNEGTDAVMDVPLGGVCEMLYGEGRRRDDDDVHSDFE